MNNLFSIFIYSFFIIPYSLIASCYSSDSNKLKNDTIKVKPLNEITITATRTSIPLNQVPSSASVVSDDVLNTLPKSISADEALRFVPGVKIYKEDDDSRLHISMRGQGILSERGIRGITILIDGIAVNDPSGFAYDLYDVDWATVKSIEVMHGPESSLFGSSSSGGIINIITADGGPKPLNIMIDGVYGSDAFWKTLMQVDGTMNNFNYMVSYSHMMGNGFREHSAFYGDIFKSKVKYQISKFQLTNLFTVSDYFNQTAESINLQELNTNPLQANPDAIPYNEYQKTQRLSEAVLGNYIINDNQNIQLNGYIKFTNYTQADDISIDYRPMFATGCSTQYNHTTNLTNLMNLTNLTNHISFGSDYKYQSINEHQYKAAYNADSDDNDNNDADCDDRYDESYPKTDTLLANQVILQRSIGIFFIDKLDIYKKLFLSFNIRYDYINNTLVDNLKTHEDNAGVFVPGDLSGSRNFNNTTARIGLAYDFSNAKSDNLKPNNLTIYANWETGFLPPATEELINNPVGFGGLNPLIVPATSSGEELGLRGNSNNLISDNLISVNYDFTIFAMNTKNDFFRYLLTSTRGNQNAFYGNIGSSFRYGAEAFMSFKIHHLTFDIAYTYSHFRYTSPDSIKNQWLPDVPENEINAELSYKFIKNLSCGIETQYQSKWYIFTDVNDYNISQNGFNIYNFRITYNWKLSFVKGDVSFYINNLANQKYVSFTEPDPEKYSYNPGTGREYFINVKLFF